MLKVHEYNGLLKEYKEEELVSVVADLTITLMGQSRLWIALLSQKQRA